MAVNIGGYLGIKKEATSGTAEAHGSSDTFRYVALNGKMAKLESKITIIPLPNVTSYGKLSGGPGVEEAMVSGEMVVTPGVLGDFLTALVGAPVTTGTGPYVHTWDVAPRAIPSFTLEGKDGMGAMVVAGAKVGKVDFKLSSDALLTATFDAMGLSKIEGSSGGTVTPAPETTIFYSKNCHISIDGTVLNCKIEDLGITLDFAKEALKGLGSATACGVEPTGVGSSVATLKLRNQSAADATRFSAYFAKYKAGDAVPVIFDFGQGFTITYLEARFQNDPTLDTNGTLGIARASVQLEAYGANIVSVGLSNLIPTY